MYRRRRHWTSQPTTVAAVTVTCAVPSAVLGMLLGAVISTQDTDRPIVAADPPSVVATATGVVTAPATSSPEVMPAGNPDLDSSTVEPTAPAGEPPTVTAEPTAPMTRSVFTSEPAPTTTRRRSVEPSTTTSAPPTTSSVPEPSTSITPPSTTPHNPPSGPPPITSPSSPAASPAATP